MPLPATLIADLQSLLPPAAVVADPAHLPAYGTDFWAPRGVPGVVVRPQSPTDVCTTLRFAATHGLPVVPRAAGTNIGAGFLPTPDRLLLDLRSLNRILAIDVERREAVVEPGVLNGTLQAHLAPFGLCFSPDPASAPIATIGGNIAENAGGPHCLKYGVTVHHVASLACALPDGALVRFRADDPGPDLLGLLIGSEGTLGVVTEATLRLRPLPAVTHTLLAVFDHAEAATAAVSATLAAGILPAALEFFDQAAARLFEAFAPSGYPTDAAALLLVDLEGSAADVAQERPRVEALLASSAREIRRAEDAVTRAALWRGRLQAGQALQASGWDYVICDTTVPRPAIPAMQQAATAIAQQHGLRLLTQGHAGDGNIPPSAALPSPERPAGGGGARRGRCAHRRRPRPRGHADGRTWRGQ